MGTYCFYPDEYSWYLDVSELNDNLFDTISRLSMYPDDITDHREDKEGCEYKSGFIWGFEIAYSNNYPNVNRLCVEENNLSKIIKLLKDNGYSEISHRDVIENS